MEATVGADVVEVLRQRFGDVEHIGAGAWSTAFRCVIDGEPMVVRVGKHVDDFRLDEEMSAYSSADLPIPVVSHVERLAAPHDDFFLCVSTFAPGEPLEHVAADEWADLVPSVVALLGALRSVHRPVAAVVQPWSELLREVPPNDRGRLAGWRDQLEGQPDQFDTYQRVMRRLNDLSEAPSVRSVSPTLLHCDLINRNVHVQDNRITGVFDWGCRRWGDHLFDFAWFQFWDPWMTTLDVELLQAELVAEWGAPPDEDRMAVCLLYIGAEHLIYNAFIGDTAAGVDLTRRISELGLIE